MRLLIEIEEEVMPYEISDKNFSKQTYVSKNDIENSLTHMHNQIVESHRNQEPKKYGNT